MLAPRCNGSTGDDDDGDEGAVNSFEQQSGTRGLAGLERIRLETQHDFTGCGCDSRRQQQVPDIRFAAEQRHDWPGSLAHSLARNEWMGTPADTSANHTAQNTPVIRQASA